MMLVARNWAKKNPKKFVDICLKEYREDELCDLRDAFREVPAVAREIAKAQAAGKEARATYEKNLERVRTEYDRIMDTMYFGDCAEAIKTLASFQHLVESL